MNYSAIKYCDIANGTGVRTVLFVSGCRNRCKGCFQPETWDFAHGEPFTAVVEEELLASLEPDYVSGITLLGGDPFEPENQRALLPFLQKVRQHFPSKDIWAYTGYLLNEDLICGGKCHTEVTDDMLACVDILVDGPFIEEQASMMLKFKGSANQRVIDMQRWRESGQLADMYENEEELRQ